MNKNFPAPKKDTEFKKYWKKFLPKVVERDNFHISHLEQLAILCDLYLEYHDLSLFLKDHGYSYESDGRYGLKMVEYPEVKIRQKIVSEIRQYCRVLGLLLNKDQMKNGEGDEDEWS